MCMCVRAMALDRHALRWGSHTALGVWLAHLINKFVVAETCPSITISEEMITVLTRYRPIVLELI